MTLKELAEKMRRRVIRWREGDRIAERNRIGDILTEEDVSDFDVIMEYLGHHKPDREPKTKGNEIKV